MVIMTEQLIKDNASCCWGKYLTNKLELILADKGYHDQAEKYFMLGVEKVKNPELHDFYKHIYDSVKTVENLIRYNTRWHK